MNKRFNVIWCLLFHRKKWTKDVYGSTWTNMTIAKCPKCDCKHVVHWAWWQRP